MIYDCFTFFNELDLLELRLQTLKEVVDRFVICEATRTFTGIPKKLVFDDNRKRFSEFADRISYIVVDDLLPREDVGKDPYKCPWINENHQRNALIRGLGDAHDDDVFMISDLDEIPRPDAVVASARMVALGHPVRLILDNYNYFLNYRNCFYPHWRLGTVVALCKELRINAAAALARCDRYLVASENSTPTVSRIRFCPCRKEIKNAGWHFSYIGGIEAIHGKLQSFSHTEFSKISRKDIELRLANGEDIFGRGEKFFAEPVGLSFPDCVRNYPQRWRNFIYPCDKSYLRRVRAKRRLTILKGTFYRLVVSLVPPKAAHRLVAWRNRYFNWKNARKS